MAVAEPTKYLHYDIIETLGSGGNGTVYRVIDTRSQQAVALKTLRSVSDVTLNRFKREFLSLKKMNNPGIVKVYDGFFDHNPPFFTMEWVRGKTLSQVISDLERNPLIFSVADRESFALRLALQVCDILTYIHAFDEVHRDLKPDNIFITLDKGNIISEFHAKMLDFGLLKQLSEKEEQDTQGGMIVGTVHYLSPEQAKGTTLDPRSDLYSLGVIIYKIVSLRLPYEAGDVVGYIFKTVFEDPTPIETQTPESSKQVQQMLRDLLAKEPSKRPPSAAALKKRIMAILHQPVTLTDIDASDLDFASGIEGFGSPLLPPPLIGREEAIQSLERLSQLVENAGPIAAIVTGEPGMGKSSVTQEWRSRIKFKNPYIMQVHFSEEVLPSQDPIGMLMDSLIRNMKPEEVKLVFRDVYPFLSSVSRYLSRYFDTKSVGKFDHLSPSRKLQVLAVNFIKLIQNLADRGPVLIQLEDIHNAPERFYGWLTLFWEQIGNKKMILMMTGVNDTAKTAFIQFKARLKDDPRTLMLNLEPLQQKQVVKLLQSMLPIGTEMPFSERLQKLITERAAGNPYYTIELFSRLYEDGLITVTKGSIDVKSITDVDLPVSIHQALLKKVQRLPPDANSLLQTASIFGVIFDYEWFKDASGWPEERFLENLMILLKLGLLSEEDRPVHKLHFIAPSMQKLIYDEMPENLRRARHDAAARAMEARLKADDIMALEQVAVHYSNAANYVRAVKYSYLAGNGALELKEVDKAIYFYELTLEMMEKMDNKQARNLVNLKLAEVHLTNSQPDKAIAYYTASLNVRNLSKMEELRALRGRMMCYQNTQQFDLALRDSLQLCRLGASCSTRIQAETHFTYGRMAWLANGDANAYMQETETARQLYPKLKEWPLHLPWAQLLNNDAALAAETLQSGLQLRPELSPALLLMSGFVRYFSGDFKKSQELVNQAQFANPDIATQSDPSLMVCHALMTYKIKETLMPEHGAEEYLAIAARYIERFGLDQLKILVPVVQLEQLLMAGAYSKAWKLTLKLSESSVDLPQTYHMRHLFICLALRAAWEMRERAPRGWLLMFNKMRQEDPKTFILQTHWSLAKAAEALLPMSTQGAVALKLLKDSETQLVKMKFKYYYRAVLQKQILLLRDAGQAEVLEKLLALRGKIDASLGIPMPSN